MATFYPIKIGKFKFLVNPTKISVSKKSQISETRTMGGTTFQIWPDLPDEISFEGLSFGYQTIKELRGLQSQIDRSPGNKLTQLTYKSKVYDVYLREMKIEADADNPRQYRYSFSMVSKDHFAIDTMPIGQLTGIKAEFDYQAAQLQQASGVLASMPGDVFNNASSVYGQIFGKTGSSQHGLRLFIGRSRSGLLG